MSKPHVKNIFGISEVGVERSRTRKKPVATASRREGVYNRTGEPSVTFTKRRNKGAGGWLIFCRRQKNKPEQNSICSDVARLEGFEPPAFWSVAKRSISFFPIFRDFLFQIFLKMYL